MQNEPFRSPALTVRLFVCLFAFNATRWYCIKIQTTKDIVEPSDSQ